MQLKCFLRRGPVRGGSWQRHKSSSTGLPAGRGSVTLDSWVWSENYVIDLTIGDRHRALAIDLSHNVGRAMLPEKHQPDRMVQVLMGNAIV